MSTSIPRFLTEDSASNQKSIETAFAAACQLCKQTGTNHITLVYPQKNIFPSSEIASFLGESSAKALCKGKAVSLFDGITLSFELPKNLQLHCHYGVVIGAHLTKQDTMVLDSIQAATAIIFLSWNEEEGKQWLSTWSPKIIGPSSWSVNNEPLLTEFEAELGRLTRAINLSTGLAHPSDKQNANNTLKALSQKGYSVDAEIIRQWAIRNNWSPKHAAELSKLAAKYFD